MKTRLPVLLMLVALSSSAWAGCATKKSDLLFEYVSTPPLLVGDADPSLVLMVDVAGCAIAHFPAHDTRRGDYRLQLDAAATAALKHELKGHGMHTMSATASHRRAQKLEASAHDKAASLHRVLDENLIEVRFRAGSDKRAALETITVATLRNDLLLLPADRGLADFAALVDRFERLAESARRQGVEVQP